MEFEISKAKYIYRDIRIECEYYATFFDIFYNNLMLEKP
jgi:hypothetical protein